MNARPIRVPSCCALAAMAALLGHPALAQMEEAPVPPINTQSRQAVIDAYRQYYLTSAAPPIEWTGSVSPVNPGTTSLAFRKATLQRLNWYRRMAGNLPNVVFDPQLNAKCQAGALMVSAAGMFTPLAPAEIPTSWPAYTPEGVVGAQSSNLALGAFGPDAVDAYVADNSEVEVGHRASLTLPHRVRMGTGDIEAVASTSRANTIWSGSDGLSARIDATVAWPPAGYMTLGDPLRQHWPRYWSFEVFRSANTGGALATVSVRKNGALITAPVVGPRPIWDMGEDRPTAGDIYEITISNYFILGVPETITYRVLPIDPDASKLVNVSTRLRVETGDGVGIAGFVVAGDRPRRCIIRAMGPSLVAAGVSGTLSDPTLEIRNSTGDLVARNNDWQTQEAVGGGFPVLSVSDTSLAPADPRESAIVLDLPSGAYTAIVRGISGEMGISLVEVYDLAADNIDSRAINVSTRGRVQQGDAAMIGGLVVSGLKPVRVVIRALGPSLQASGVQGVLEDPVLEVRDANGALISLRDDRQPNDAADLGDLLPLDLREPAVSLVLVPGAYTAIVHGKAGAVGVALVEAYER